MINMMDDNDWPTDKKVSRCGNINLQEGSNKPSMEAARNYDDRVIIISIVVGRL